MTAIVTREPILVVADVIQQELDLAPDQVMLEFEKIDINADPGLYIALAVQSSKVIGNNNYGSAAVAGGMTETQQAAVQQVIQIDVMSFDASARKRKEEVVMALMSMLSQRLQEDNAMQIARIPGNFLNASSLEETKILNRFTITITVNAIYSKTKDAEYFDRFRGPDVTVNT